MKALPALGMTLAVSACGLIGESSAPKAGPVADTEAATRAVCGAGSREETGLQGQVPKADRDSGRSLEGYWCNLERVGQYEGQGASWQFAWYDDCGYYDQKAPNDLLEVPGTVVVDGSDPAQPVATGHLQTAAMMDPWESLKTSGRRGLLAAYESTGGAGGPGFSIHDVAADCRQPKLLADVQFPGTYGHEGAMAPDGMTYYGSGSASSAATPPNIAVNAVDISDPSKPQLLLNWDTAHGNATATHGLSISEDGTRAYLASVGTNGLVIADFSQIQARTPNPAVTLLGAVSWSDGAINQHTVPFTSRGKPYVLFVDEGGFGAARIIDVGNELAPSIVSKLKLEIHLPQNAAEAAADGAAGIIQYDGHYCSVDRTVDPTAVACGYAWSGVRVFDIRDVAHPKEIAYYIPPAKTEDRAGSQTAAADRADKCTAQVRFVAERGELWTTCQNNGFLVLRFTNGVWPVRG
ncbi:MAG TPA: hypothetical protein VM369_04885 [Candidatus Binatia bacterium]|nr:hypothetical protein [Candidatus Binatia bacterium]